MKRKTNKCRVLLVSESISKLALAKSERVIEMANYLYKNGYEVYVLTSKDENNYSFCQGVEVIDSLSIEPYFKFPLLNRLINPFQDSMFYSYVVGLWNAKGTVAKLSVDIVISSGPPHSIHWIGNYLTNNNNVKWIIDLRDAWRGNRLFKYGTYIHRLISNYVYKNYLSKASLILANTDSLKILIQKHNVCNDDKIITVPNGFIERNFEGLVDKQELPKFDFLYSGSHYNYSAVRKIEHIFSCLDGQISGKTVSFLGDDFVGFKYCKSLGRCDSSQVPSFLLSSKILLLFLPSEEEDSARVLLKLYSYLKSGRPIILIGPRSATSDMIEKYSDLYIVDHNKPEEFLIAYNQIVESKRYTNYKVSDFDLSYEHSFSKLESKIKELSI